MTLRVSALIFALCSSTGFGAVSLFFSDFDGSLANRSDSVSSSAVNGLAWGIVVDTEGNDFSEPLQATGLTISDGANFGNGYEFYLGEGLTAQSVSIVGVQQGAVSIVDNLDVTANLQGKRFAVIWFDGDQTTVAGVGQSYGLELNPGLVLPNSNSGNQIYTDLYTSALPVANTNLAFVPVPEPSTAILATLGALGIFRRRR